jgi:hypothetical protein
LPESNTPQDVQSRKVIGGWREMLDYGGQLNGKWLNGLWKTL